MRSTLSSRRAASTLIIILCAWLGGCAAGVQASAGFSVDTRGRTAFLGRITTSVGTGGRQGSTRSPEEERVFGTLHVSLAAGVRLDQRGYRLSFDTGFGFVIVDPNPAYFGQGAVFQHTDVVWDEHGNERTAVGVGFSLGGLGALGGVPGVADPNGSISAFGGTFDFALVFPEDDEVDVEGLFYFGPLYGFLAFDEPLG